MQEDEKRGELEIIGSHFSLLTVSPACSWPQYAWSKSADSSQSGLYLAPINTKIGDHVLYFYKNKNNDNPMVLNNLRSEYGDTWIDNSDYSNYPTIEEIIQNNLKPNLYSEV